MRRFERSRALTSAVLMTVMAAGSPTAVAAQSRPSEDGVAPMITVTNRTRPGEDRTTVLIDRRGVVTCDGRDVSPIYSESLAPRVFAEAPPFPGARGPGTPSPIAQETFAFSINADGEPRSIGKSVRSDEVIVVSDESDAGVQASLASWRFPPEARSDCRLTVSGTRVVSSEADVPLLARALALGSDRNLASQLRAALTQSGQDCANMPSPRTSVAPDRTKGHPPPGGRAWTVARFDAAADGSIHNATVVASSGDGDWDEEVTSAVGQTILSSGPRTGCIAAFQREGANLPMPPAPDVQHLNHCTPEQRARLTPGALTYPDAFQDRGIEGWALVRFSMASWGEINDISVLDAQPAAAFGDAATRLYRAGRATPARDHAVECVDRVFFRMPSERDASDAE